MIVLVCINSKYRSDVTMMWVKWFIVGLIDTILKALQYGWFIIVPIILVILILFYKRKKVKNIH